MDIGCGENVVEKCEEEKKLTFKVTENQKHKKINKTKKQKISKNDSCFVMFKKITN